MQDIPEKKPKTSSKPSFLCGSRDGCVFAPCHFQRLQEHPDLIFFSFLFGKNEGKPLKKQGCPWKTPQQSKELLEQTKDPEKLWALPGRGPCCCRSTEKEYFLVSKRGSRTQESHKNKSVLTDIFQRFC